MIAAKADVGKLVDAGAILDLTDLIEEHAPNIKKMLGDKIVRTKYNLDDQAIYAIPTHSSVDEKKIKADGALNSNTVSSRRLDILKYVR